MRYNETVLKIHIHSSIIFRPVIEDKRREIFGIFKDKKEPQGFHILIIESL